MYTLGHVQYGVDVVSINNLERHEHLNIKDLFGYNTLIHILQMCELDKIVAHASKFNLI